MTMNQGDTKRTREQEPPMGEPNFNVEADISRLKRSSYIIAASLIVLLIAFLGFVALSLMGHFAATSAPNPPQVAQVVYPIDDNLQVYTEAAKQAEVLLTLKKTDKLYQLERTAGMTKVAKGEIIGWVENEKIKTKLELAGVLDPRRGRVRLNMNLTPSWNKKDLMVDGKITNNSGFPLENLNFTVYFLSATMEVLFTQTKAVYEQKEMAPEEASSFNMMGINLMGKVSYVAYEIDDVDPILPPEPEPTPVPEGEEGVEPDETKPAGK